jgi:uncharacterized protein
MRINIEEIGEDGFDLEEKLSRAWLEGILAVDRYSLFSATGPAQLNAHLEKVEESVLLRASVSPELATECGRCLKPVEVTVPVNFTLSLVPEKRAASRQGVENDGVAPDAVGRGSFDPTQADEETFKGRSIDLEPLVREQILLALPMESLCRDSCKGICPSCGQDLNERSCGCSVASSDPRWEKLRSLKVSN